MSLRFLLSSSKTPPVGSSGSFTWTAWAKLICWPWREAECIDWAVCITDCWLAWITDGVCIGGGIEVCGELCWRTCPCWTVTVLPFSISVTLAWSSICSMFESTTWRYGIRKVGTRESFLFRDLYKEPEEEKPMRSASRSLEQIQLQSDRVLHSRNRQKNVAKIIIPSLSTRWNLEERENETYMLRHFYVTLISLRSQRVVVFLLLREQQPRHCGVTTGAVLCYCGVDRPCRVLLHHHYVRALPFSAIYGKKPSGADLKSLTSLYWVAWKLITEVRNYGTISRARLQSKCHPGTSCLRQKVDRDKSELKHFANRKKIYIFFIKLRNLYMLIYKSQLTVLWHIHSQSHHFIFTCQYIFARGGVSWRNGQWSVI